MESAHHGPEGNVEVLCGLDVGTTREFDESEYFTKLARKRIERALQRCAFGCDRVRRRIELDSEARRGATFDGFLPLPTEERVSEDDETPAAGHLSRFEARRAKGAEHGLLHQVFRSLEVPFEGARSPKERRSKHG